MRYPVLERAALVQAVGLPVQGEPDTGPHQWVGAQPVGQHHAGVDQFLQLDALRVQRGGVLLVEHALGEVFLGLEVEVEGTLGDFGHPEDLGDGGGLVALLLEDVGGRFEDLPAGADRSVLLGHSRPFPGLR